MNFKKNNNIYSIEQKIFAEIVKEKDEYIKNLIMKFAKKESKKLGKDIEVIFVDENRTRLIIDLGLQEFCRISELPIKEQNIFFDKSEYINDLRQENEDLRQQLQELLYKEEN